MTIYVYTDGASRGNPGRSASGYSIFGVNGKPLSRLSFYNGMRTNNEAEYLAVIAALGKAAEISGKDEEVVLRSDSELVIRQLNGEYKVRDSKLKGLNADAKRLMKGLRSCRLENVRREDRHISEVDKDLNRLLDCLE